MKILITGASSGIGKQLALDYLNAGHHVALCGRDKAALDSLANEFPALSSVHVFDITDYQACQNQLAKLEFLDLAILNAGTCEYISAMDFDARAFERVVMTNLVGLGNCLEAVIPKLKSGGRLALMGSSSSYLPLPRAEAYGASKAATEYLAHTLSISLKASNIHCSYVAPGFVKTPLSDRNDFPMPMRISVETASHAIREGLRKGKSEIHFPGKFTWLLKAGSKFPLAVQKFFIYRTISKS